MPGGENNNKPGVKLPVAKTLKGGAQPTTILESVIRQTGAYAASRKGRLSVYWSGCLQPPSSSLFFLTPPHTSALHGALTSARR